MKLAPYPAYKDSGVAWLGEVPEHWENRKLRNMLKHVSLRNRPDLPLLSVVREKGVIKRNITNNEENHNYIPDDLSNYKVVTKGQFAMNKMKAWQGSYGISNFDGIVSPAYFIFHLNGAEGMFFHIAIRSKAYVPFFTQASDGVRIGQWDLAIPRMKDIPFFIPPLPEQTDIAHFLDWKTSQINKFIKNKKRLIALLKEQKQVIINDVVTGKYAVKRIVDADRQERLEASPRPPKAMRPSGVDWLGDIPKHWELSRVKREFHCLNNQRIPLSSTERGAMKHRIYDYYGASGVIDKVDDYIYDDDLLLIAEDGANLVLRNLQLVIIAKGKFWVNNHAHILKPKNGNINFLEHYLEQIDYRPWISGAAQPKLTKDRLFALYIAVPPRQEQDEIVKSIKQRTSSIDQAISRAEREITLIQEYRTRLISDVVTGKIDVRSIEVPEVMEDIEADPCNDLDEDLVKCDDVLIDG